MFRVVVLPLLLSAVFAGTARAGGSFQSSDPLLDKIWQQSVRTAEDMLAPGGQTYDALGRYCPVPGGRTVILDGLERDRCPYIGDESVIDLTFDSANPHWDVQRSMLRMFAAGQHRDGAIPSSPLLGGMILFDYCGYWAMVLHDYVLYSGDVGFGREMWPHLVRLMDTWYVGQTGPSGLLVNRRGYPDYGFLPRRGATVAYFNAQYVYVLGQAAQLAGWLGRTGYQQKWKARATRVSRAFSAFWDASAGAYTDTTVDRATHPQDGNSFAVLAGVGTRQQWLSALDYLSAHNSYSYGNSISDVPTWDDPDWGYQSNLRVYPFMGFYEVKARFETGRDDSALDLIRREWGYMVRNGPGTMWEVIGPFGGGPTDHWQSWDAGWSSGAAPALTQYVLGVVPTSPGFATYTVKPHPGDLQWAKGDVPTPRGTIHVEWRKNGVGQTIVTSKLVTQERRRARRAAPRADPG